MTTLRFPLAGAWGAVCAAALFAVLARLVNVPLDVPKPLDERILDFTKIRPSTPVETKRRQKPTRTPPPATPGRPRLDVVTEGIGPPTRLVRPVVDVRLKDGPRPLGTDRDVQPIVRFPPEYPQRLVTRGVEGWVKVQFTIAPSGAVKDAFVVDASPPSVFDDAALKAIARWRYNPRIDHGTAVERVGMQTVIRFELDTL
jgi:protein TonB